MTTDTDPLRDVTTYDARRAEVAAMIDEADRQGDEPMGPDGLADALMEIADGWYRAALSSPPTPTCADCGGDHPSGHPWHTPPSTATTDTDPLPWNESNPEWWKLQVETRGEIAWAWLVNEWAALAAPSPPTLDAPLSFNDGSPVFPTTNTDPLRADEWLTPGAALARSSFSQYRKTALTPISDITYPPGTKFQTREGLRAEDEETRCAFDVQGGIYPIRESVFVASYEIAALSSPPTLDDLAIERTARQHFEPRRHFFEDVTASGVCSECGESHDQDFIRVPMHFNDGDG